ncbi:hypothetical protein [Tellurirhabdus bombi]|nr:hypothetical protein [Tellurirhabdus bombi]
MTSPIDKNPERALYALPILAIALTIAVGFLFMGWIWPMIRVLLALF